MASPSPGARCCGLEAAAGPGEADIAERAGSAARRSLLLSLGSAAGRLMARRIELGGVDAAAPLRRRGGCFLPTSLARSTSWLAVSCRVAAGVVLTSSLSFEPSIFSVESCCSTISSAVAPTRWKSAALGCGDTLKLFEIIARCADFGGTPLTPVDGGASVRAANVNAPRARLLVFGRGRSRGTHAVVRFARR